MKIVLKNNTEKVATIIVSVGNKKYTRIQNSEKKEEGVVWKNTKTNSPVNKERFKILEDKFIKTHGKFFSALKTITPTRSRIQPVSVEQAVLSTIKSNSTTMTIDSQLFEFIKTGQLLGAVKAYKEIMGLGLKESKDYVDYLNKIYRDSKLPIQDVDDKLLIAITKSFDKNSDKKTFINNQKKINNVFGEYVCLMEMSKSKGWNTIASKLFYDIFIK